MGEPGYEARSKDTSENFLFIFCNVTANEKEVYNTVSGACNIARSASTWNGKYLHQVYHETIFGLFCKT